ncbi:MAG TPA: prepilin-type N-terminal cleavage/methylation domain-containing protein, partial [Candidatus Saccharimonadia bacterium]|nr:prepilin-type N-terminal cleavage/methylation domain-containing protein [Candidatus Saccharimonadia bacterium]
MRRADLGFTLIELMITVAVLAVLLALAAPSFSDSIARARLKGAADGVVSLVEEARQQSTRLDRDVNLSFRGSAGNWCVGARAAATPAVGQPVAAAPACDCSSAAASCMVGDAQMVAASSSFGPTNGTATIDAADVAVVFDRKLGTLQDFATAGAVVLSQPSTDLQLQVGINALGHARVCVPGGKPVFGGYRT